MELYRNWVSASMHPLLYLKTPKEAMASVKTYLLILFVVLLAVLTYLSHWAYRKWVAKDFELAKPLKWWHSPIFIFLAATMIIPIRGGFGIAPMNPGKVYFSQNNFSNHAALKAPTSQLVLGATTVPRARATSTGSGRTAALLDPCSQSPSITL